ncbi:MAG: hypothetical protein ACI9DQ_001402 [Glaciecola sp.]|jgi:hypothetical protein
MGKQIFRGMLAQDPNYANVFLHLASKLKTNSLLVFLDKQGTTILTQLNRCSLKMGNIDKVKSRRYT